jgi:DNA-binding MarR family transcriptional regulator
MCEVPEEPAMAHNNSGEDKPGRPEERNGSRYRILVALRQIARTFDIHSRKLASDKNVTSPQLFAMKMLTMQDVQTATEISRKMHVSPSTIVGILDRLEEKDLVERRRDTSDRRVVRVLLTDKARELLAETPHPIEALMSRSQNGLTDEEAARMAECLERLVSVLGATSVDGETPYGDLPETDEMPPQVD